MAFTLPTFNLTVDIYTGPWATRSFRLSSDANLAWGRRVSFLYGSATDTSTSAASYMQTLLLPAGTDIRSALLTGQGDMVEVPQGSGRWYFVQAVDDIAKGFSNEHRAALVQAVSQYTDFTHFPGLFWPVPMP